MASMASAQDAERIQLDYSDELIGKEKDGRKFNLLKGNVRLSQKNTQMFADSVYLYRDDNSMEAFGRVRIFDGDSIQIFGDYLRYNGNTGVSILRDNVEFTDRLIRLYTDNLDYYRGSYQAKYAEGGRLVDSVNVLTSETGFYRTRRKQLDFFGEVKLVNKEYTLTSDTLYYNTLTKFAETIGYTRIVDKEGQIIIAEEGSTFQTDQRVSQFAGSFIETADYDLKGDVMAADDIYKIYRAARNVELIAREDSLKITGKFGDYYKGEGITKVYGDAIMHKFNPNDTLYVRADTLLSREYEDSTQNKIIAYNHVLIYSEEYTGKADSLHYSAKDSSLYLLVNPYVWSKNTQLNADQIQLTFDEGEIHKALLSNNAFVIQTDTAGNFNQVKGREITAWFEDGEIAEVWVDGNAESIVFALEDLQTIGMNKIEASNIKVFFEEGDLSGMTFLNKPKGTFIPPHELEEPETRLTDFEWLIDDKPLLTQVLEESPYDSLLMQLDPKTFPLLDEVRLEFETRRVVQDSINKIEALKKKEEEETKKLEEVNEEKEVGEKEVGEKEEEEKEKKLETSETIEGEEKTESEAAVKEKENKEEGTKETGEKEGEKKNEETGKEESKKSNRKVKKKKKEEDSLAISLI
jgi:lipopolysaccharide export system protein LptA